MAKVAMDYCFMGDKVEDDRLSDKCMPILVVRDAVASAVDSFVVPNKGTVHAYPAVTLAKAIERYGHDTIIVRSDGERSLVEVKRAASVILREKHGITVRPEESKVGDSKSNGFIERAIWEVESLVRTLVHQSNEMHKVKLGAQDEILTWAVVFAGQLLTRAQRSQLDGRTAWERLKGHSYKLALPKWSELVMYMSVNPEQRKRRHKLEERFECGAFLGAC